MCDQPGYTSLAVGGEGESPMVCGRLVHTSLLVVRCQGDILGTSITGVWLQLAQGLCPGISISSLSWWARHLCRTAPTVHNIICGLEALAFVLCLNSLLFCLA